MQNQRKFTQLKMLISSRFQVTLTLLACLMLSACNQQEEGVRQYRVPKESVVSNSSGPSKETFGTDQVWFFKLTAPTAEFEKTSSEFAQMFIGVDVSEGAPKYKLPPNWTSESGPAPAYETLNINDAGSSSVTVTPLPSPSSDPVGYLKINIDRWRRQLSLPPLSSEDWLQEAQKNSEIVSMPKGDHFLSLVHLTGQTEKLGETHMLVGIVSQESLTGTAAMAVPPSRPAGPASSKIDYELPKGWKEAPGNGISLVALTAPHKSGDASFTVTRLNGGGDILPNINRWRGQVKLDPIKEDELKELVEKTAVDGISGTYSMLEGPESAILAVILEQDGAKWFFKLQGPAAAVKAEEEHFKEILKTVKLNIDSE